MKNVARILHITDTHLKPAGSPFARDDAKVNAPIPRETREEALDMTFRRLVERLEERNVMLDGVVFCGDGLSGGVSGGDKLLLDALLQHFEGRGITASKVVAVPGNHDVPKGAEPDSQHRYESFLQTWRQAGCITPWLDGIDDGEFDYARHVLLGPQSAWAVVAINSSNWSHVNAVPKELDAVWDSMPSFVSGGDLANEGKVREALTKLAQYDMARISPKQLEAVRGMLRKLPGPDTGRQLRILAMHHHLRAPSLAEEVKAFSDISNLEQVRTFVAQQDFRMVLHGHKHVGKVQAEFIELKEDEPPHKVIVVAGASFSPSDHSDAIRVLTLGGLPWAPSLEVESHEVPRGGIEAGQSPTHKRRIWSPVENASDAPVVVQGSDFDEVYAKAVLAAQNEARDGTLIIQLDLRDFGALKRLPIEYPPTPDGVAGGEEWLKELVDWWQLPQSQLHLRVPYLHGTRLHRYGNSLNQVKRVSALLEKGQTTRAIALLVDPAIDFHDEADSKAEFASFCLVQFTRRTDSDGQDLIDCVGYYRAQEMVQWWPINVAELHHLQQQVGAPFDAMPGRITTVTACARAQARAPTHVAMPVVDRWLDQSPEKFFVLANALLNEDPMESKAEGVLNEWVLALDALAKTAIANTPDGGPVVAIEGPRRLAAYLLSGSGARKSECHRLARDLTEIARLGSSPPPSKRIEERRDWGERLAGLLQSVADECRSFRAQKN